MGPQTLTLPVKKYIIYFTEKHFDFYYHHSDSDEDRDDQSYPKDIRELRINKHWCGLPESIKLYDLIRLGVLTNAATSAAAAAALLERVYSVRFSGHWRLQRQLSREWR